MAEEQVKRRRRRRRKKKRVQHERAYVLIGMPGSGKSALGKRVARLLGWPFVDTDDVLSARVGMTVGELSQSASNEEFRREEEAAVLSGKQAMRYLKQIGTVIYLDLPLWLLIRRIGDSAERRGIILKPRQSIGDIFHERKGLYKRYADIEFQTYRLSPGKSSRLLTNVIRFLEDDGSLYQEALEKKAGDTDGGED